MSASTQQPLNTWDDGTGGGDVVALQREIASLFADFVPNMLDACLKICCLKDRTITLHIDDNQCRGSGIPRAAVRPLVRIGGDLWMICPLHPTSDDANLNEHCRGHGAHITKIGQRLFSLEIRIYCHN